MTPAQTRRGKRSNAVTRRALPLAVTLAAALGAASPARAQQAAQDQGANGLRPSVESGRTAQQGEEDDQLKRLDEGSLAGGDYGGPDPQPLAGGDYGRDANALPDTAAPRPSLLTDPLAAPPGGTRTRLRPAPVSDDDAYAPVGVRAGAFILKPSIETAVGHNTNPDALPDGKSSKFYRLRGDLDATSDWDRHELSAKLSGQVRRYVDLKDPGYEPEFNGVIDGRLDVAERTQITSELRASLTATRPGDPDTPNNLKGDEIEKSAGVTLGVAQQFNRFSLKLEGLADRYLFDDAKTQNGTKINNKDRIYNGYEARLRGSYELSPGLKPFVEVAADTRDYDERFDDAGRRLGSSGYALRTGAELEMSRLVTGELAVGYGRQTPKEKSLDPVDGLLLDGSLAWAATGLTTVRATAKTAFQETTLPGAGGVLTRNFGLAVEHRLRRNLIVTARAEFDRSDYKGIGRIDDDVVLALEGEYRLNRSVALIGSFQHEKLNSNVAGEDYKSSLVEFGMRFRR